MKILFNPPFGDMAIERKARIVFVHVGKCAGGSVILSLGKTLPDNYIMFELHCHNANRVLRDVVQNDASDLVYLVTKRDPIDRFISAFNWDKHNQYLSGKLKDQKVNGYFEEFPTVDTLARAIGSDDRKISDHALNFTKFGHMGMGQAWYTPLDIVRALPKERTFTCDTRSFRDDILRLIKTLNPSQADEGIIFPKHKADFTAAYENPNELFSTNLTAEGRRNLRILLNDDFFVYREINNRLEKH